jgi:hypothetical protein
MTFEQLSQIGAVRRSAMSADSCGGAVEAGLSGVMAQHRSTAASSTAAS